MKMDKRIKAGVAAAVVAAGVSVNRAFSPEELTEEMTEPAPEQIVEPADTGTADAVLAAYTEERRMSRADRLRSRFLRRPTAVKSGVLLPLWAVGAAPAALVTALTPLWRVLAGLGLHGAALAALFALVYKLLFPQKKVRELFRKKNIKWFVLATLVLTAANVLLGELWAGWPALRAVLMLALGYFVIWLLWKRLCGRLRGPEGKVRTQLRAEYGKES